MDTLLFSDPIFLEHETGAHPETAERLRAILRTLDESGLRQRCQSGKFEPLQASELRAIHSSTVIERAEMVAESGGGHLDEDTVVSPASYRVALAAAGACTSAVDAVLTSPTKQAVCLVRPPGHHATPTRSMGFCLFNNIAMAARHAQAKHGVNRILIVDWDVHHGNGTQDVFYDDPSVCFVSIHRYGHGFYPGTGAANETGIGDAIGTNINLPIRFGTTRQEFLDRLRTALETAADRAKPELILISAGFDAHRLDPIGNLGLETEDYIETTGIVRELAGVHSADRIVSCLEGGYHWQATADSVRVHLETLLSD